ncbi:MAG: AAA family ATPase [Eubacteriales bacterium]
MVVNRVCIKNFRGIEEATIELKEGFNLIKGENGKGKTSILEAISVGLGGYISGINDVATRHFSKEEIRKVVELIGDASCNITYQVPTEVVMNVTLEGEGYEWTRGRSSVSSSRSTTQPRNICKLAERMSLDTNVEYPVLIFQGAGRVWSQKKDKSKSVFTKQYSRTVGYTDTLLEASSIKLLLNWCMKMEQAAWKKNSTIAEYESVKEAVALFMSCMNGKKEFHLFYDKVLEELMYGENDMILPVNSLSAGYQSLIWMVFDIAYRMAVLNPLKKEQIAQTKGIVLIDEIDMHLHPRWQWKIIDALRTVFPNVQFIATTHAPILFASAKDVWVIDIEEKEYQYGYSHYGIDLNTAIKQYQDTNDIPFTIQEQVDEFYDELDQGNVNEAKEILEKLEIETAPTHPLLVQMRTRYEFEVLDLED